MFGVNHLGHFLLTDLLRERLVASAPSRVVVVSSIAHRWAIGGPEPIRSPDHRSFTGSPAYGRSKLANAMFALRAGPAARGHRGHGQRVHPGSIYSGFGGDGDTGFLGKLIQVTGRVVLRSPNRGAQTRAAGQHPPSPGWPQVDRGLLVPRPPVAAVASRPRRRGGPTGCGRERAARRAGRREPQARASSPPVQLGRPGPGALRVVAGVAGGLRLEVPPGSATRPTVRPGPRGDLQRPREPRRRRRTPRCWTRSPGAARWASRRCRAVRPVPRSPRRRRGTGGVRGQPARPPGSLDQATGGGPTGGAGARPGRARSTWCSSTRPTPSPGGTTSWRLVAVLSVDAVVVIESDREVDLPPGLVASDPRPTAVRWSSSQPLPEPRRDPSAVPGVLRPHPQRPPRAHRGGVPAVRLGRGGGHRQPAEGHRAVRPRRAPAR
jgi:NAD(P)-dependent dehydrogenase (short-subunit alcohol dehydrogenase family)